MTTRVNLGSMLLKMMFQSSPADFELAPEYTLHFTVSTSLIPHEVLRDSGTTSRIILPSLPTKRQKRGLAALPCVTSPRLTGRLMPSQNTGLVGTPPG